MKKILSTDPSSRPYSSFRSAAISSLFTRNHRKMRRDRAIDRHVLIGRQVSEDFSPGGQIIENKIFFIYSLYGDVPQCGHGCGWSSTVPISANGPRAVRAHVPRMHGEKVSLFIFFCRLRSLVCRSHDLRHFRFPATQRFPPSQCLSHDDSAHAIFIRRYNGLHCCYTRTASIADFDTRKDAWFDSQTRRWTHLRELNVRRKETLDGSRRGNSTRLLRGVLRARFYKHARLFGNKSFSNLWSLSLFYFFFFFYRRVNER